MKVQNKMRHLTTVALLCACQVFGERFSLEEAPDPILQLLESTYRIVQFNASSDAGKPLILTSYILENEIPAAREAARVDPDLFLGVESYAGYLTVNKEYNANLWFWYIPVSGKPVEEVPWIVWLQGGPGLSSLFGVFTETGPFVVKDDRLEKYKYSWGENHSLVFFDNPVGTGFSFTDDERGYATNQTTIGENLYTALQQFLTIFPELRAAPLIIAGESYAGKYKGLAIGNGLIDPEHITNHSSFLLETGLVDDKIAKQIANMEADLKKAFEEGDTLEIYHKYIQILGPFVKQSELPGYNLYNFIDDSRHNDPYFQPFIKLVQQDEMRRALHVGNSSFGEIANVYNRLICDLLSSARPWLEELLDNYRVLLYNGHLDVIVGYRPSVNTFNVLEFSGADEYRNAERKVWHHNDLVAGFYKIGGNLLEVMVRGAGHMVPSDKPSAALGLISAFARGLSLERDTGYLVDDEPSITLPTCRTESKNVNNL